MTLDEAKALLSTASRNELRDHAFGDCEVTWERDGAVVADGYFGTEAASVAVGRVTFVGESAWALRDLGARGAVERNDSTGPEAYAEGRTMPALTPAGVLAEITSRRI